ncbi:MAG: PAS domain S-box protein [Candidatus Saliniplasma sp.]
MIRKLEDEMYESIRESGLIETSANKEDIFQKISELIIKHSYDMISLLDLEFNPIFVNYAHKRVLGYNKEDLLSEPALELFHPEDKERVKEVWSKVIEEKEDRERIVGRFEAKEGGYIWLETHLKTLTNEDGEIVFILCISRDISDKIEVEKRLKSNKEKVEKLHLVAHELDTCRTEEEISETILDASTSILNFDYISIFKKVKDGFEAKALSYEIEPKLKGNIHDKSNYTWQTYITGKSFLVDDIETDKRAEAGLTEYKSGLSIPVGEWGVFQALSKEKNRYDKDDLKMAELLVSHMEHALDRIRYRYKLKESVERYRSIFENTGTATIILEEDTTINLANEEVEKISGYSKEEIEGKMSFKEVLVKDDVEKLRRYHHVRRHDGKSVPSQYEAQLVTKYGDVRDVLVTVGMIPNSDKSIASILDITNYRKNLRDLRKSDETFRVTFDKSLIGMMRLDTDLNIKDVNEKALEFFDELEENLLKKNFKDLVHEEDKEIFRELARKAIDGKSMRYELNLRDNEDLKNNIKIDSITDIEGETKYLLLQFI